MTQPPVVPTPWPHQPPPRSGHRALIIVVVAVAVVIAGLVGTCALVVGRTLGASRAYFDVANDYLAALEEGDADAAYALLCPEVTSSVSPAQLADAMERVQRPTQRRLNSYSTVTSGGTTTHTLRGKVDVRETPADITIEFEGDEVLVCGASGSTEESQAAVWPAGEVRR